MVENCSCDSDPIDESSKEVKQNHIVEVKKILSEGVYYQWELADGRKVLDLIPDEKYNGGEGTRYLLSKPRDRDVLMTQINDKPSKQGKLLDEGRYKMVYHCEPKDGGNPDIHNELDLHPKSTGRYYKLQHMRPPHQDYVEFYCYPGVGSPNPVI